MARASSTLRGKLIFSFGSRRSGTYWLQRMISAHPQVSPVPSETHLFSHGIAPLMERFHQGAKDSTTTGQMYADREVVVEAVRDLCDAVFEPFLAPGAERVAERTPLHVLQLPLLTEIYPDARFVHIIRDGRDVARSIAAQNWGPASVAEAAAEWRDAVLAGREGAPGPESYMEVRYERLLSDPDPEIRALYGWLGLDDGPEAIAAGVAEAGVRKNVDPSWKGGVGSGKWQQAFGPEELEAFKGVAGELLEELGYERAGATKEAKAATTSARPAGSRLRRALGGLRKAGASAPADQPAVAQAMLDLVLEALAVGDEGAIADLLCEDAAVTIRGGPAPGAGRGADGREALQRALRAEHPFGRTQRDGQAYVAVPTSVAVLSFGDGQDARRAVVAITLRGECIATLDLHLP